MFEFHGDDRKILVVIQELVDDFRHYKRCFEDEKDKIFSPEEQADLFFQFKAFMEIKVEESKKEMCTKLGFDFDGKDEEKMQEQAAYVACMVNQLRVVIFDIRLEALQYYNDQYCDELRKCPHCGIIWAKVEGCEYTTCGDVSEEITFDTSTKNKVSLANFCFSIEDGDLVIKRNGKTNFVNKKKSKNIGCGQPIDWSTMSPVETPEEFHFKPGKKVTANEIAPLPDGADAVYRLIDKQLNKTKQKGKMEYPKRK